MISIISCRLFYKELLWTGMWTIFYSISHAPRYYRYYATTYDDTAQ